MKNIFKHLALVGIILLTLSCNRKLNNPNAILGKLIEIEGQKCKEKILSGIDSKVGMIICPDFELAYDVGSQAYTGPRSLTEQFKKGFNAVHYANFFRRLGVEERNYSHFKERVKVISSSPREEFKGDLMFECEPCNAVGTVLFDMEVYHYPYSEAASALAFYRNTTVDYLMRDGYLYSYFYNADEKGVYISASDSRKMADPISIILRDTAEVDRAFEILKKVNRINPPTMPQ